MTGIYHIGLELQQQQIGSRALLRQSITHGGDRPFLEPNPSASPASGNFHKNGLVYWSSGVYSQWLKLICTDIWGEMYIYAEVT